MKYKICPLCLSYLKDHSLIGWRACPNCDYRIQKENAMVSLTELNPLNYDLNEEETNNINILLEKINKIRTLWGNPMKITSGVRSKEKQIEVYKTKGITDLSKIPMNSQHLHAAACDVYDPNKELQQWCKDNEDKLEEIGLWMEDFSATPDWVHFQIYPPKSGKRWFQP